MIRVTDHAFVRFLERSGAADVDEMRNLIARTLERGRRQAERAGITDYAIVADGLRYVVRGNELVTVLEDSMRRRR